MERDTDWKAVTRRCQIEIINANDFILSNYIFSTNNKFIELKLL